MKPLVYLDHNVLDYFSKNPSDIILHDLVKDFQFVFSLENIREIKRSKGYENRFTSLLDSIGAKYLNVLSDSDHRITDNFTLRDVASWEEILFEDPEEAAHRESMDAMLNFSLKMTGGLKGRKFSDIIADQKMALEKLLAPFLNLSKEEQGELGVDVNALLEKAKGELEDMESTISKSIPDDEGWDGVNDYREKLKIGPQQLNNIRPPNVVAKIWEEMSKSPLIGSTGLSLEDVLGLKTNFTFPGKPFYDFEKVIAVYNFLNWNGYYPDKELTKNKRFIASTSDQSHAGYGIFTNAFFTADERLFRKASAAYEYLNFQTQVFLFDRKTKEEP